MPAPAGTNIESNFYGADTKYSYELSLSSTAGPIDMYSFSIEQGKMKMIK